MLKAIQEFAGSGRIWSVASRQDFVDRKYHAGAGTLFEKKSASLRLESPPGIETRLAVWALALKGQTLYFFPDRILVYQGSQVGAVAYQDFSVSSEEVRFVEQDSVPSDTQVVGQTWRYLNKDGTPDRRFSNNRQLPVVLYADISLRSGTGLNVVLQSSNPSKASSFQSGLDGYLRWRARASADQPASSPTSAVKPGR